MCGHKVTASGEYLDITILRIAKVDGTKLMFSLVDRDQLPDTPPINYWFIFLTVQNQGPNPWNFRTDWELRSGDEARQTTGRDQDLSYPLSKLPNWEDSRGVIPSQEEKNFLLVYRVAEIGEGDWKLTYNLDLYNAWRGNIDKISGTKKVELSETTETVQFTLSKRDREQLRLE